MLDQIAAWHRFAVAHRIAASLTRVLRRLISAALAALLVFGVVLEGGPALAAERAPVAAGAGPATAAVPGVAPVPPPTLRVSGREVPLLVLEGLAVGEREEVAAGAQRLADLFERDLGPLSPPGADPSDGSSSGQDGGSAAGPEGGIEMPPEALTWTDWPSFAQALWELWWRDVPQPALSPPGTPSGDSQRLITRGTVDLWLEEALVRANLEPFEILAASLAADRQTYGAGAFAAESADPTEPSDPVAAAALPAWYHAVGRLEGLYLDDLLRVHVEPLTLGWVLHRMREEGAPSTRTDEAASPPAQADSLDLARRVAAALGDDPEIAARLAADYLQGRMVLPLADLFAVGPGGWPAYWGRVRDQEFASIGVRVDGRPLAMDVAPALENGRTLVPLRAIFEALDATVDYDSAPRRITAASGDRHVVLWPDDPLARIDSRLVWLDAPPVIRDGRTLVPVRFVSEALGATVDWVDATRTVVIRRATAPPAELPPESPEGRKVAYLTFDDGPSSQHTAEVLGILGRYGVKGTFFLIGKSAKAYPDLVRREVEEGHALGNHSFDHDYSRIYASPQTFLASVEAAEEAIFKVAGLRPRLLRAPGGTAGNFDRRYFDLLHEQGYVIFDWNVSTADSTLPRPSATDILTNVDAYSYGGKVKPIIILMHDGPGHESTVEALPAVIHYLVQQGYLLRPLTPDSPLAK